MIERLSFAQIHQALVVMLTVGSKPFQYKNLDINTELDTQPDSYLTRSIRTHRYEGYEAAGFKLYPGRGARTYDLAKALADFLTQEMGISPSVIYEQKNLFGMRKKNGSIRVEFPNRDLIEAAINRHPNPAIREMVNDIRAKRIAEEQAIIAQREEAARKEQEDIARRLERHAYVSRRKGPAYVNDQPLVAEALCVVHATKFLPRMHADGTAEIDTTSTATDGAIFRNTVHVALNHKVAGHMYGSWDDVPFTIIGNFVAAVETNGIPQSLNTVDTWWTRGWNEPLCVPEALIVMPGETGEALHHVSLRQATYKAKDFTLSEAVSLSGILDSDKTQAYDRINRLMDDALPVGRFDGHPEFWERLGSLATSMPNEALKHVLETVFQFSPAAALKAEMAFTATNNSKTIDAAIDYLGYRVYPGGMWAWGGSWGVTDSTRLLAEQMGTVCTNHSNARQHDLETVLNGFLARKALNGSEQNIDAVTDLLKDPEIDGRSKQVAQGILYKHGFKQFEPGQSSPEADAQPLPRRFDAGTKLKKPAL